jgi:hypothetical protein
MISHQTFTQIYLTYFLKQNHNYKTVVIKVIYIKHSLNINNFQSKTEK